MTTEIGADMMRGRQVVGVGAVKRSGRCIVVVAELVTGWSALDLW